MFNAFSPDGTVTYKTCPVCRTLEKMKVEHGVEAYYDPDVKRITKTGGKMEYWHCLDCGDSLVMVIAKE